MRVRITPEAAAFVTEQGGQLWVWAARPRMCCAGAPAMMRAATTPPVGLSGFSRVPAADTDACTALNMHVRPTAGMLPEILEVELRGRRHRQIAAYWDGCLMAMV